MLLYIFLVKTNCLVTIDAMKISSSRFVQLLSFDIVGSYEVSVSERKTTSKLFHFESYGRSTSAYYFLKS